MPPASQEAGIKKTKIRGQQGKKVSETPISANKLGMVMHACDSSYAGHK
jgi:hypothetical protein